MTPPAPEARPCAQRRGKAGSQGPMTPPAPEARPCAQRRGKAGSQGPMTTPVPKARPKARSSEVLQDLVGYLVRGAVVRGHGQLGDFDVQRTAGLHQVPELGAA